MLPLRLPCEARGGARGRRKTKNAPFASKEEARGAKEIKQKITGGGSRGPSSASGYFFFNPCLRPQASSYFLLKKTKMLPLRLPLLLFFFFNFLCSCLVFIIIFIIIIKIRTRGRRKKTKNAPFAPPRRGGAQRKQGEACFLLFFFFTFARASFLLLFLL
jgi:hypothetical protein